MLSVVEAIQATLKGKRMADEPEFHKLFLGASRKAMFHEEDNVIYIFDIEPVITLHAYCQSEEGGDIATKVASRGKWEDL